MNEKCRFCPLGEKLAEGLMRGSVQRVRAAIVKAVLDLLILQFAICILHFAILSAGSSAKCKVKNEKCRFSPLGAEVEDPGVPAGAGRRPDEGVVFELRVASYATR